MSCVVDDGNLHESDVLVLTLDLTDIESHAAAVDAVIKHFGQVTIIVSRLCLCLLM